MVWSRISILLTGQQSALSKLSDNGIDEIVRALKTTDETEEMGLPKSMSPIARN